MQQFNLIATAAAGLEAVVGKELQHLGYETKVENSRVRFSGGLDDIIKTNLWSRVSDRIKIIVGEFDAYSFEQLFDQTYALPWADYLPLDAAFPVSGKSHKSKLHATPRVQAIVKKAIVNKMNATYHRTTNLPETGATYPLEVAINKDHVLITLDTTGSSLFKRGYRVAKGAAPLKENFAAALVLLARWYPEMPLIDPVCGSGTIPIEAAMMGLNIAPGLRRHFAFENFAWVPTQLVQDAKNAAEDAIDFSQKLDISGFDIDGSMIEIAKQNAINAGVSQTINFKQQAMKDFTCDKINGVIVANPPYGERLSDQAGVRQLYATMGAKFATLPSFSKYILTSDMGFEQAYGSKATKRRKLYNGSLRVDYFQYWGKKIRTNNAGRQK